MAATSTRKNWTHTNPLNLPHISSLKIVKLYFTPITCPPYPLLHVCVCVWGGGGGWGRLGERNDIDKATGNRLSKMLPGN